jgi:hypothetical protein
MPILNKLLTSGNAPCDADVESDEAHADSESSPTVVLPNNSRIYDRRKARKERRNGAHDMRADRSERRVNTRDRREAENHAVSETASDPVSVSASNPIPESDSIPSVQQVQ